MNQFAKFGRSTPVIVSLVVTGMVGDSLISAGLISSDDQDHTVPFGVVGTTTSSASLAATQFVAYNSITGDEICQQLPNGWPLGAMEGKK